MQANSPDLKRLLAKDPAAWEAVFKQHYPSLYAGFCSKPGLSQQDAEDLTQETFAKAIANIAQFRPEIGTFSQWLFGIANYEFLSFLRTRRRKRESSEAESEQLQSPRGTAADSFEQEERDFLIHAALAKLTEEDQLVLKERIFEVRAVKDMAQQAGISEGAMSERIRRAKRQLQAHLREFKNTRDTSEDL